MAFGVLPNWIKIWLVCSTLICSADVAFTTLRPESLRDGNYGKFFTLWNIYAGVDTRYANETDPMTRVTGPLMCVELVLNLIALFTDFVGSAHSLMAAFLSSSLVFWKTTIYLCLFLVPIEERYGCLQYGNNSQLSHRGIASQTPFWKELLVFWTPNSVWVFIPLLAVLQLWRQIARGWTQPSPEAVADLAFENCRKTFVNELRELCALDELDPAAGKEWIDFHCVAIVFQSWPMRERRRRGEEAAGDTHISTN
uniref:EXPERA domain-containing protein n=1 Tax=Globodera rostochiensis TaxID=31243 RepID=A0A914H196_GLORO